jgi:hypothetical protein
MRCRRLQEADVVAAGRASGPQLAANPAPVAAETLALQMEYRERANV